MGHGEGTTTCGSPGMRVAAYKACYDTANRPDTVCDYLMDLSAIGTFFAVQSGVAVVCFAIQSGVDALNAVLGNLLVLLVARATLSLLDASFHLADAHNSSKIE